MTKPNQFRQFAALLLTVTFVFGAIPSANAKLITFDDIPAGLIGNQYLSQGVEFYLGNGQFGTSTALLLQGGLPVTANVGNFNTSISQPNVMNPGLAQPNANEDIIAQFYDQNGQRTSATSVGVFNDTDGHPIHIVLQGFDVNGASLGQTDIFGPGVGGTFSAPNIYFAMIWSPSGQAGIIGVDNFSFTLAVPEPASVVLLCIGVACLLAGRNRRARRCLAVA